MMTQYFITTNVVNNIMNAMLSLSYLTTYLPLDSLNILVFFLKMDFLLGLSRLIILLFVL